MVWFFFCSSHRPSKQSDHYIVWEGNRVNIGAIDYPATEPGVSLVHFPELNFIFILLPPQACSSVVPIWDSHSFQFHDWRKPTSALGFCPVFQWTPSSTRTGLPFTTVWVPRFWPTPILHLVLHTIYGPWGCLSHFFIQPCLTYIFLKSCVCWEQRCAQISTYRAILIKSLSMLPFRTFFQAAGGKNVLRMELNLA